jgi:hypothetical protein
MYKYHITKLSLNEERDKSTIVVGNFTAYLSVIDRSRIKKI